MYRQREKKRARETVKDDIAKGNGHAETEVTGAGWMMDSRNSSSEVGKLTKTRSDALVSRSQIHLARALRETSDAL